MYKPIEGGTKITLRYGGYEVWVPPKPSDSDIAGFNLKRSQQKFQRTLLPDYWEERSEEEEYKRSLQLPELEAGDIKKEDLFVDEVLERFRRNEWKKRDHGYWFFNNGVPVYITGAHYFYLNWTHWNHTENDGYPIFYDNQVHRFYFRRLCETDLRCLGYVILGNRGFGKSSEEIGCITDRNTKFPRQKQAAFQSKTDDDAQKLFINKLVPMFNDLPDFFKPVFSHSSQPTSELNFSRPRVMGKKAKNVKYKPEEELLNRIYWAGANDHTLDGEDLQDILNDEIGKSKKHVTDVANRIEINRLCVYRNQRKVGLIRACSTVEEMENDLCKTVWDDADPDRRTDNGMTINGLYRWRESVLDTDRNFADEFGVISQDFINPDFGKNILDYHYAERKAREHNHDKFAGWVRKNPMYESDMWIRKPGSSTFNSMVITNYKNELAKHNNLWVRGNFKFLGEDFKSPVEFERDDINGRWQVCWLLDEAGMPYGENVKTKLANNVFRDRDYAKNRMMIYPGNNHLMNFGVDPIKDVKTKDPRASKMSAKLFFKYNDNFDRGKELADWFSHRFIARYHQRLDDPYECFKDVAMGMLYFGCWANIEKNVGDFHTYLKGVGMEPFIMTGLDFDMDMAFANNSRKNEEAVQTTHEVHQSGINRIRKFYTRHYPERVIANPWVETQDQYLDFEPEQITRFDEVVADMYALLGAEAIVPDQYQPNINEETLNQWFDFADISGNEPRMVEDEEFDFDETLY